MKHSRLLPFTIAGFILTAACSDDRAVPRPEGFPRIEAYPETYTSLPGNSRPEFIVNDSARIVSVREAPTGSSDRWYTLYYPRYGALLYLTFTATAPEGSTTVIDNRLKRMALNSGGARSILTTLESPGGYKSRLMTTPAGTVTPVQFLSVRDDRKIIVSGAVFIDGASSASSPDSLAPVINYLERDILHALKNLK